MLLPISHCLDQCSFIVSLEIRQCESFKCVIFQNSFGYSDSFAFLYRFNNQLVHSWKKNPAGILIMIVLNFQLNLGKGDVLISSLSVHGHGISLHLFRSSLIFFISVSNVFVYRYHTYFVRFLPKYFIIVVLL